MANYRNGRVQNRRHGFTVIELVIGLATVGVLASICYSVFAAKILPPRHREQCQGNLRQIGLAIKQYLADNGDTFPVVSSGGKYYGWADSVEPYFKETGLLQCPAERTWPRDKDGATAKSYTDYLFNSNLSRQKGAWLQSPAIYVMLGDAVSGDARQHSDGGGGRLRHEIESLVNRYDVPVGAATRHLDGANYAFADGHVKWLRGTDAITTPALRTCATCCGNPRFYIG